MKIQRRVLSCASATEYLHHKWVEGTYSGRRHALVGKVAASSSNVFPVLTSLLPNGRREVLRTSTSLFFNLDQGTGVSRCKRGGICASYEAPVSS